MRKLIFIISLMTISVVSYSQSSRAYARQGNGAYEKGKMDEADLYYRKSLEAKDNDKVNEALYNLGNALYKKEDYAKGDYHWRTREWDCYSPGDQGCQQQGRHECRC